MHVFEASGIKVLFGTVKSVCEAGYGADDDQAAIWLWAGEQGEQGDGGTCVSLPLPGELLGVSMCTFVIKRV